MIPTASARDEYYVYVGELSGAAFLIDLGVGPPCTLRGTVLVDDGENS
jgi:hypothetical protein